MASTPGPTLTLKAAIYTRYGPPGVLELKVVEKPRPGARDLLIRIDATVVEATDAIFRSGDNFAARLATGAFRPKHNILGFELAGAIEAVGSEVTRFKPGDRVFGSTSPVSGTYAQFICVPEDSALATMPSNTTCDEAVAVCDGGLTALPFLRDEAHIHHGQQVLINGASGSVGTAAVQLAKYFGAEVTGVCSARNLKLVKSLGADLVIDYRQQDFARAGQTYDIIFDTVGKRSFTQCRPALKQSGIYLSTVLTPTILWQTLWTSRIGSKRAKIAFAGLRSTGDRTEDLVLLRELIETGRIKPVIDKRYTLDQIAEAHAYVDTGHKAGGVVITMSHDNDS